MSIFKDKSTQELITEMWRQVIPASIGTISGVILMFGAVFWRFFLRPWYLLIEYSDGEKVWTNLTSMPLYRGQFPPELPMEANVIPSIIFLTGAFAAWILPKPWRDIKNELMRRIQQCTNEGT